MKTAATQSESTKGRQPETVALIITHKIRPGEEERYEAWLADIFEASCRFPGYLDRDIFRPHDGGRKYTSMVRFDSLDSLNGWAESETRESFVSKVHDLLEEGDQVEIKSGIDFWFTPKGVKPPKLWKQFVLTVSAVYPLSLIIPLFVLIPLGKLVPVLSNAFVAALLMAVILTGMLTFVIMPPYTRLLKRWLYGDEE
jgi:antibiotic biosynthesis monooxygenase (ABM) superfamily enzyme